MAIVKKPMTKPVPNPVHAVSDEAFEAFVGKAPDATTSKVPSVKMIMKGKQAQVTIHMSPALLSELNSYAASNELGLSRNQVISAAVRAWLADKQV